MRSLAARGYVGANVTVPHKEAALALSQPDDRARAVGAANTLWFERRRLRSTNTDVEGFLGQSRRLRAGLGSRTWHKAVRARRRRRRARRDLRPARRAASNGSSSPTARPGAAEALQRALSASGVHGCRLGRARRRARRRRAPGQHHDARHAGPARPRDRSRRACPATPIVADLVYVPLVTPLMAAAKARDLRGRRRAGHVAASGGARLCAVVRQKAGSDRGIARADRSRSGLLRGQAPPE